MRVIWAPTALFLFLLQPHVVAGSTEVKLPPESSCKTFDYSTWEYMEYMEYNPFPDHVTSHWCCKDEHCVGTEGSQACPELRVPLESTCHGKCYSAIQKIYGESPIYGDEHDFYDYHFVPACENSTICVDSFNMCNGTHQCQDKGDLSWCKQPERKQEECPTHFFPIDTFIRILTVVI